ncbi:hypothetical protein H8S20_19035 [Clostridium sp. NSJ-6]|uniref:YbbR-like protein n=1 Tax=Clostridium hominis TaxID=2763036 RepID=A0ABR7DHK7_9CLOT|nr:CdaR family protein [Clostridium hominis]MBC5630925.1 hypothetical protein [Clostridium hominis]MDU2673743.1 CdaR family protein [Clostridium sp.]
MDNWNNKQKVIVQIVCLLLSVALWFYVTNVENPIKTQDINKVPVKLMNEGVLRDSNLILAPNQQFFVNLKVEGTTQDLRKISKDDFEITIDLSEYAYKVGANKIPVHIVDSPARVAIKNNSSLTLTIYIDEYIKRDVEITSEIDIIAKPTYYVAPIEFAKSKVTISGPKSAVDKVYSVVARGEEYNVNETISKSYHLYPVDENGNKIENVTLSQDTVDATIKVNEGKVVPIKINTVGQLTSGLRLKDFTPNYKEVELSGPKEILDTIDVIESDVVNLSNITGNTSIDVALKIPDKVQVNLGEVQSISINVVVESEVSKEVTVEVALNGLSEGLTLDAPNKSIRIKVSGYEEDIKNITSESITASLDLSSYTEAGQFTEDPTIALITPNDKVRIEALDKVSFNIEKIVTETPPTE